MLRFPRKKELNQRIPYSTVAENRRKNPFHQWPESVNDSLETAYKRISGCGFVPVWNEPSFHLSRDAQVFTMGSCFARNVEEALMDAGLNVLTRAVDIPPEHYSAPARPNAVLNKYNVHSIASELSRAFDSDYSLDDSLVYLEDDRCFDPLLSHIKPNTPEIIAAISRQVIQLNQSLADADVVFITLGQNEAWFDEETGIYLNMPPPRAALKRYPERFSVHLSDYQDNMRALETVMQQIGEATRKSPRIVITVSPVPMQNTLSAMDVITANSYSKSMLRTCAQALAVNYPEVDYFPSYEMVMHSDRACAWHEDTRHVQDRMVRFVVSEFLERYLEK